LTKTNTFEITGAVASRDLFSLPSPAADKGVPLMAALKERRSVRTFSEEPVTDQQLSELLWAANGISSSPETHEDKGLRTAPSAKNHQEIELYVFLPSGIYLYDALNNQLALIRDGDHRSSAGRQPFFEEAPLSVCLVADFSKMGNYLEKKRAFFSGLDAGYVSQNIYLYCASEGLATVACGMINRKLLHPLLKLEDAKAMLSHPVGVRKI